MSDGLAGEISVVHNFGIVRLGLRRRFERRPADHLNLTQEAVTPARHGFDVTRLIGRFPQHVAQLLDGGVDAVIEFHDGVVRPEPEADLVAKDHLAGMLQQHEEDLERLFPQAEPDAEFAQLARSGVDFERPEAKHLGLWSG